MRYLLHRGGWDGRAMLVGLCALAMTAAFAAAVRAAPPDEAGATTRPVVSAAAAPAATLDDGKVLLLPLQLVVGHGAVDSWIGRSIQQSLMTDLITGGSHAVATSNADPADANAAAAAGRNAGARYVLFGQLHVNHQDDGSVAVRVTGQLLDAGTGRPVGALKATGFVDDLFTLEDELSAQARVQLDRLAAAAAAAAGAASAPDQRPVASAPARATQPAPTIEPSGPVRFGGDAASGGYDPYWYESDAVAVPQVAYNRYYFGVPYGGYSSPYFYGGYGYGYPYYGSAVAVQVFNAGSMAAAAGAVGNAVPAWGPAWRTAGARPAVNTGGGGGGHYYPHPAPAVRSNYGGNISTYVRRAARYGR